MDKLEQQVRDALFSRTTAHLGEHRILKTAFTKFDKVPRRSRPVALRSLCLTHSTFKMTENDLLRALVRAFARTRLRTLLVLSMCTNSLKRSSTSVCTQPKGGSPAREGCQSTWSRDSSNAMTMIKAGMSTTKSFAALS